ncbi:AT-rich interactive domain-containing protein 1 isoform X3 [Arabidopsis lyrata subsp. lyrata]|uniref:AT-rich interactive domain-containing protein 1 isoform X3 n=1 Tax=Arabidopsis lyrata subsp. lyrata TaxID=81972 RepID=UPI000A29B0AA|nr:AT-rich interactive domain-containing protein 1 isoform X3 [Arabidopsis lyrata subsp. lyrata]|eukprot:XP_020885490.1 AT-rich interactive domain-containing protein 1 isoform X3 [Arabidopsis lyrata subsp. lyrata]
MGSVNCCRVRCSLLMAGWSMVADEDAVDPSKTPKNLDANRSPESVNPESTRSGFEKKIKELISLFRPLLDSFLAEFCSADSFRPLPAMTGDGKIVDLFSLFLNVSHKGGFDAVSENGSWDEVAQESGLESHNSASAKLIYVKYLDALARWLNRVIAGDTDVSSVELSGISDALVARLQVFLSEVKKKYELRKGRPAKELGAELKWFISKTKRRYDKYHVGKESGSNDAVIGIQGSKLTDKRMEQIMILESGNQKCSSPGKRKRECPLETLKWLSEVAKDPCHPSVGRVPDRSKWVSYGSEEPWKQLLLFRASRTNNDSACEKTWQKLQKMHPCLYDDSAGPSYNLRERLSYDDYKRGKTSSGNGSDSGSSDEEDRPCALVGSEFQAEVPEWTDITPESDTKWLGTRIWPLTKEQTNRNLLIERDRIGKGRQDPCGCHSPGSTECVKFHITAKQDKLKLELGPAFYMWCFDVMGEGTLHYWTDLELKKIKSLMSSPPSLSPAFFDQAKMILSSKGRGKIVSYFYNVTLLQYRANQSRITPHDIDSDTDQLFIRATQNENPAPEANTSQKPALLSPKKKRCR